MITDRAFGASMPKYVRDKLRARQELASGKVADKDPLEASQTELGQDLPKSNFNFEADLSSRTAWARMWVGVKLTGAEKDENDETNFVELGRQVYIIGTNNLSEMSSFKGPHESLSINEEGFATTGEIEGNVVDDNAKEVAQYDAFPLEHGVYGDHNKFMKPDAGITSVSSETEGEIGEIRKTTVNFMVQNFHDFDRIYNNYFLRPGAKIYVDFGWDSLEEPLYDPLTWINEHHSENFELKLYGDSTLGDEPDGFVTLNKGDCDTVHGQVVDYNSKILANGSVECSLTIQSLNAALMKQSSSGQAPNDKEAEAVLKKFEADIDNTLLFESIFGFMSEETRDELGKYVVGAGKSPENRKTFEQFVKSSADTIFGGDITWMPKHASSLSGIFIKGGETYIMWGLFEDRFLNNYFAHGTSLDRINSNDKEENKIAFNSATSFACLDANEMDGIGVTSVLYERQFDTNLGDGGSPSFLIPEQWDYSYNTIKDKSGMTRAQREQSVKKATAQNLNDIKEASKAMFKKANTFENSKLIETTQEYKKLNHLTYVNNNFSKCVITQADVSLNQIPLREVFINTTVIKEAFGNAVGKDEGGSVQEIVNDILSSISEEIGGPNNRLLWDWRIKGTAANNLSIVDFNWDPKVRAEKESDQIEAIENYYASEKFSDMFTFNIMGPDSIVNDYQVEFSMPDGDYANMMMAEALHASDAQYFPPSELIKNTMAFQTLLASINSDISSADIVFESIPELGLYKAADTAQQQQEAQLAKLNYADKYELLMSSNPTDLGYWLPDDDIEELLTDENAEIYQLLPEEEKAKKEEDKKEERITQDEKAELKNQKNKKNLLSDEQLHTENSAYWKSILEGTQMMDKAQMKPIPLPMKLTLSFYGCGIIQVGDVFKVDYLPQIYLQKCYFQTIKVSHAIDSTGWYTTLETIFNITPDKYVDKSLAEHDKEAQTKRNLIDLQYLSKDNPKLLEQLKGMASRYELSYTQQKQILDKEDKERIAAEAEERRISTLNARFASDGLELDANKALTVDAKKNKYLRGFISYDSSMLKDHQDDYANCIYHTYSGADSPSTYGNHFGIKPNCPYSYSGAGWEYDERETYKTPYKHLNCRDMEDLINNHSEKWQYTLINGQHPSFYFDSDATNVGIGQVYRFTTKGGSKTPSNGKGGVYFANPMFLRVKSGTWYYDGYGYGGKTGGKYRNQSWQKFITDCTRANGNYNNFYVNARDKKCWGIWPSWESGTGLSLNSFKSRMNHSGVGWSRSASGYTSYTIRKNA